jgi:hypothetical protein
LGEVAFLSKLIKYSKKTHYMKNVIIQVIFSSFMISTFTSCNENITEQNKKEEYIVNKASMSCNCIAQLTTASPIGNKHLGPYATKQEAINAMCADIDKTSSNPNKCWSASPIGTCK